MAASRALKFGSHLKELRIHLCQKSPASAGVREFVEKFYVPLKEANANFPILVRECSGVQPKIFARYALGVEKSVAVSNAKAEDVMKNIEQLARQQ